MSIQKQIESDLKLAIQNRDEVRKGSLKIIVGELRRLKNKILTDEETVVVLRQLKKWETGRLKLLGFDRSIYLDIVSRYIPPQASEQEIKEWIEVNIDLSKFKNKLAAIKPTLNHFGITVTDKPFIRKVIESM